MTTNSKKNLSHVIIFTDMDSTLFTKTTTVSIYNMMAIDALAKRGALIVPITGRNASGPWKIMLDIFPNSPYRVFCNGAHIQKLDQNGSVIADIPVTKDAPISSDLYYAIYAAVTDWNLNSKYKTYQCAISEHTTKNGYVTKEHLLCRTCDSESCSTINVIEIGQLKYADADYTVKEKPLFVKDTILKLTCSVPYVIKDEFFNHINGYIRNKSVHDSYYEKIKPRQNIEAQISQSTSPKDVVLFEVTSIGIDKGAAVEKVLELIKADPRHSNKYIEKIDIYAIGDGMNDLPMMDYMIAKNHTPVVLLNSNLHNHIKELKNKQVLGQYKFTPFDFDNNGWGEYFSKRFELNILQSNVSSALNIKWTELHNNPWMNVYIKKMKELIEEKEPVIGGGSKSKKPPIVKIPSKMFFRNIPSRKKRPAK